MTEKAISPAKDLRIGFFITGAFFLFNPFITIVDFLPDFIGALLFVLALYKLRDMSDHMESARTGFLRFFWISLSRIPAFLIMFWVSHNFSAERSIILVFTFCYAVLETILLAFCFNSLFDGFIYVGERNEGTAIFRTVPTKRVNGEYVFAPRKVENYNKNVGNKRKRRKKIPLGVTGVKRLSIITFLLLRALSVLPELVYIADNGNDLSAAQKVAPIHFKGIFTALAFIPALLLGIIWLVNFIKYIRGICADSVFCGNVLTAYELKVPKDSKLHGYRRFCRFCVFATAAAVIALDFFLDDKNAIPDLVASALLFAGVIYYTKRVNPLPAYVPMFSFIAVLFDALSQLRFNSFIGSYLYSDVWRSDEATVSYFTYLGFDTLATVAFCLTAVLLISYGVKYAKSELLCDESARNSPRIRNEIKDIRKKGIAAIVISIISAVSNVFYRLTLADTKSIAVADVKSNAISDQKIIETTHMYVPKIDMYWLIDVAISILLIFAVISLIEKLKDSLKYKYMLED